MTNRSLFRKICLIGFCFLSILISCNDDSATLDLNDDHAFSSSEIVPINKESLLIFGSKNYLYSIQKNPLPINWKADLKTANAKFLNKNNSIFLTITPEVGNTFIISIDENTGDILWKSSFNDRWNTTEYNLFYNDGNIIVEKETLAGKLERYMVNYTIGKLSKVESKVDLSTKSFSIKSNLENSIRLQNQTYLIEKIYDLPNMLLST